jgi:hypothetical protein
MKSAKLDCVYMIYGGRYTLRFFEECAKRAKKHNENYLINQLDRLIKSLGKSQEGRS